MARELKDVAEMFGFLFAQEISSNPLTPKDTTRMARSFPATFEIIEENGNYIVRFTTPFYTEYVHEGTKYMEARPFINMIAEQKGPELLQKAFKIINQRG